MNKKREQKILCVTVFKGGKNTTTQKEFTEKWIAMLRLTQDRQ